MAYKVSKMRPNYKLIYTDILLQYPEKQLLCQKILSKNNLSVLDIIELNRIIFYNKGQKLPKNRKHRAYDQDFIQQVLAYQAQHQLNNVQLAKLFGLSRNTVAKWKKIKF